MYRPLTSHSHVLDRGIGPAPVGSTRRGVNGLYDMGANVWEWVDSGEGEQKATAGGSSTEHPGCIGMIVQLSLEGRLSFI